MKNTKTKLVAAAIAAFTTVQAWAAAPEVPALMEPVKTVYERYFKIEKSLAKDSLDDVQKNAAAMAKEVRGDQMKMLSEDIAKQADALSVSKNLKTAREAFKPLSTSLIDYLAKNKVPAGQYFEAYCPMVKASWLQTDKKILNPYMGKAMPGCGQIKK